MSKEGFPVRQGCLDQSHRLTGSVQEYLQRSGLEMCAETLTGPYKDSVSAWIVACTDNSCADKSSGVRCALRGMCASPEAHKPVQPPLQSCLSAPAADFRSSALIVRSFCYMLMANCQPCSQKHFSNLRMTAHASWQAIDCPKGHLPQGPLAIQTPVSLTSVFTSTHGC